MPQPSVPGDPLDHPALAVRLAEDKGVDAQDGFAFQHDCISKLCIRMARDDSVRLVVCETHEDCIVIFLNGEAELVSCKGRSPSRPFSVGTLVSDGGLRHLRDRWDATLRTCRCRLMTDGALTDGDAKQLRDACHSRDIKRIEPWAQKLASPLGTSAEDAALFLVGLTLDIGNGPRDRLATIITRHDLRPLLRDLTLGVEHDDECYRRLFDEVRSRCRYAAADPWAHASLLEASRQPANAAHRARLAGRSIDAARIIELLVEQPSATAALDADPSSLDHTRLTAKLTRGEVGPMAIAAARRLRANWYALEASRRSRAPRAPSGFEDLRTRVLLAVAAAENTTDTTEPYGQRLYGAVVGALRLDAIAGTTVAGLSDELLLGLVFQLTDECELFWSQPFDVDEQIA